MDSKKYLSNLRSKLSTASIYIHRVSYRKKWGDFSKGKIEKILIIYPDFEETNSKYKYFNKRKKQFIQQSKLLLNNSNFVEDIIGISKNWMLLDKIFAYINEENKILPHQYFDIEHNDQLQSLWFCILKYISLLIIRKKFYTGRLNKLSKEYDIEFLLNRFKDDIKKLLKKFNLSLIWKDSIILLLLTGYFLAPQDFLPVTVKVENKQINILIHIYPEISLEDVKYNWDKVVKIKNEFYGKKRIKPTKNLDQYLKMYLKKDKDTRDLDLINFEELKIPFNKLSEERAYHTMRKGRLNIKKLMKEFEKVEISDIKFIKNFKEVTGFEFKEYRF